MAAAQGKISELRRTTMKFSFGGLVLIVFGALVLARNLGFLNISIAELIGTWWPLGLIVLGAGFFFAPDGNDRKR
jgi:hypothetical protein